MRYTLQESTCGMFSASFKHPGKLANVIIEMDTLELFVLGTTDTFWKDAGECTKTFWKDAGECTTILHNDGAIFRVKYRCTLDENTVVEEHYVIRNKT